MQDESTKNELKQRRLFFVVNAFLPNEQAHGIQILHMCDSFSRAGLSVTLLIPCTKKNGATEIQDFYAIPHTFAIEQIPVLDLPFWKAGRMAFLVRLCSFSVRLMWYLRWRGVPGDIVYTRGEMVLPAALVSSRFTLCLETHIRPGSMRLYTWAMRACALVVTVTQAWAGELTQVFKVPREKIVVEPDAVDLAVFGVSKEKMVARDMLSLPHDKTILVYTGSDRPWKGLEVFKDACVQLDSRYLTVFVGNVKEKYGDDPRVLYKGFVQHEMMPLWLSAADFLVLTGSGTAPQSQRYTSPLKLFEYMAAQRPIIASDVPSFREILDETTAYFIPTHGAQQIARLIEKITVADADVRARTAFERVQEYTWDLRAERIVAAMLCREASMAHGSGREGPREYTDRE